MYNISAFFKALVMAVRNSIYLAVFLLFADYSVAADWADNIFPNFSTCSQENSDIYYDLDKKKWMGKGLNRGNNIIYNYVPIIIGECGNEFAEISISGKFYGVEYNKIIFPTSGICGGVWSISIILNSSLFEAKKKIEKNIGGDVEAFSGSFTPVFGRPYLAKISENESVFACSMVSEED